MKLEGNTARELPVSISACFRDLTESRGAGWRPNCVDSAECNFIGYIEALRLEDELYSFRREVEATLEAHIDVVAAWAPGIESSTAGSRANFGDRHRSLLGACR